MNKLATSKNRKWKCEIGSLGQIVVGNLSILE